MPVNIYVFICHVLGTYDVQQTISLSNPVRPGTLNVTCIFALNSSALGCLSIIREMSSVTESFHVIAQSNNTLSVGDLDVGNYTIMTFDIGQNGLPGSRAAYIEEVELQNGSKNKSGTALFTKGFPIDACNTNLTYTIYIMFNIIYLHINLYFVLQKIPLLILVGLFLSL